MLNENIEHPSSVLTSKALSSDANSGLALGRIYANIKILEWVAVSVKEWAFLGRLHFACRLP